MVTVTHVNGPLGSFVVELSDVGMGPVIWEVRGTTKSGKDFHVRCGTEEEALDAARIGAGLPPEAPESVPRLTDRRGLVEHSRAQS
jgi:hypothetical protein